jgi:hypothetical protein
MPNMPRLPTLRLRLRGHRFVLPGAKLDRLTGLNRLLLKLLDRLRIRLNKEVISHRRDGASLNPFKPSKHDTLIKLEESDRM